VSRGREKPTENKLGKANTRLAIKQWYGQFAVTKDFLALQVVTVDCTLLKQQKLLRRGMSQKFKRLIRKVVKS
jgi:hypothetical protein